MRTRKTARTTPIYRTPALLGLRADEPDGLGVKVNALKFGNGPGGGGGGGGALPAIGGGGGGGWSAPPGMGGGGGGGGGWSDPPGMGGGGRSTGGGRGDVVGFSLRDVSFFCLGLGF